MQYKIIIISFLAINLIFSKFVFSQNTGKIEIFQDPRLDLLIQKHKILNEKINGIPGFRLQIFSESGTNSRNKALKIKEDFIEKFPGQDVYLLFQEPNYKVRVGDFRTELDALGYMRMIQPIFPGAFIVSDKINFPKLNH